MKSLEKFVLERNTFVVAHRGSSGTAPENTMAAFREAIAVGADMIETDIQYSSDNHIVTFHDASLDRTSDGQGQTGNVDLDKLRSLDVGSWFDSKFSNERMPLLEDLIKLIKDKVYLNIEIKNRDSSVFESELAKLLDLIIEHGIENQTLFSSFDHLLLKKIHAIDDRFHTAAIMIPGDKRLPSVICHEIGARGFVCALNEINSEIASNATENDIFVGVYCIDTIKHLEMIKDLNVKAIVTNYPGRILSELERK